MRTEWLLLLRAASAGCAGNSCCERTMDCVAYRLRACSMRMWVDCLKRLS